MNKPNCFDIEIFPNFFCITHKILNEPVLDSFIIFFDTKGQNHINQIRDVYKYLNTSGINISYNGDSYDNVILNFMVKNKEEFLKLGVKKLTELLKGFNDTVISCNNFAEFRKEPKIVSELKRCRYFKTFDMMNLFNTVDKTSLKNIAVNMKWHKIQDLPYSPNHIVLHDQITKIIEYNINDVEILEELVNRKAKDIKERAEMTPVFGFNMRQDNDTNIAKKLFAKLYNEYTGTSIRRFKNKGTFYKELKVSECLSPKIKFRTKPYASLLKRVNEKVTNPNMNEDKGKKPLFDYKDGFYEAVNKEFEFSVLSKYMKHTIAKGGIHSENMPEIIHETNDYEIWDVDVTSYYPRIMLLLKLYPKHLGPIYSRILNYIVTERVRAKEAKEKKAGILKISANSSYGLTKPVNSEFYDPRVTLSTCINGELFLLMLLEAIESRSNCIVVYSNTDGLTVKVPKGEIELFKKITKQWEEFTGFDLEFNRYKRMVIKDVNNYFIEYYTKDDIGQDIIAEKVKGCFIEEISLTKGYDCPIIAKALCEYYRNGTPITKTIRECEDLYMFFRCEKTDIHKFDIFAIRGNERTPMQKTNRWAVTHKNPNECMLFKVSKETGDKQNLQKGYKVTIFNDVLSTDTVHNSFLNYTYYEHECLKIINTIKTTNKETWVKEIVIQAILDLQS
jgi:hypothetical protein